MSLWSEHFHWRILLRWDVLGWSTGFLLGLGGLVLAFEQYSTASICFALTAGLFTAKIVHLAASTIAPARQKVVFALLLVGLVVCLTTFMILGVNKLSQRKEQETLSKPAVVPPAPPASTPQPAVVEPPREVKASGSSAEEKPASYRTLAVAIRERFEDKETIVVTQTRTVEPLTPSFRTHEFMFWQDAPGKIEFVRSDVLSTSSESPLRHSVEALEHDEYRLRLQVTLRSADVEGPFKFIVQVRQVNGYPNLFTTGSDYWELQVRNEIPSLQYALELPNRSPFDRIGLYVTDVAGTKPVQYKIEGGDIVFRFGPVRLPTGKAIKFNLINEALVRPPD